jgi:D-alanyl-D-alanine carboxypeptidase
MRLLEYPEVVHWSSTWREFIRQGTPKPFELTNRNKLVTTCPGVNGMKTGYTRRSRFCVTATCERGGRKMLCVVTGCPTSKERDNLVAALLDWAYAQPSAAMTLFPPPPAPATALSAPAQPAVSAKAAPVLPSAGNPPSPKRKR